MHLRLLQLLIVSVVALTAAGSAGASAGVQPAPVAVHVQRRLSVSADVHVSFRPSARLAAGGYYYAVIVLKPYKHYTRDALPPCATSSDMERTDYGYPTAGHPVELTLTRTASPEHDWCPNGTYIGAIYAVPHAPPCNSTYPCRSEPYEPPSPCWEIAPGRRACGVVKLRTHAYPEGLPEPRAPCAHIIAHFQVTF